MYLIKRLLDSLDVDERPPPIVKLVDRSTSCSIVRYIGYGQPVRFTPTNVMKLHAILEKLHKIIVVDTCDNHLFSRAVLSLGISRQTKSIELNILIPYW